MVDAIRATGLEDRVVQPIGTLSKGYRQRVGIAQAIIHQPDILILDEPTTGLDPTQIVEIRELIKRLAETLDGRAASTHILSEVEATCERVLIIMRGELRADAKLAELRSTNAAVVAIEAGATGVAERARRGRRRHRASSAPATATAFTRWRVTSTAATELCPALFDALRGDELEGRRAAARARRRSSACSAIWQRAGDGEEAEAAPAAAGDDGHPGPADRGEDGGRAEEAAP